MFYLEGNVFTIDTLHAYYARLGCRGFTCTSLEGVIGRLQRIQNKGTSAPSSGENVTLSDEDMLGFTEALVAAIPKDDETSHALDRLVSKVDTDDAQHNNMAIRLWINRWHDALQFETSPLAFLTTFPEASASPIQMCAVLCALIEKGVRVNDILASGLLQAYAVQHAWQMEDIEKTYRLLSEHVYESRVFSIAQSSLLLAVALIPVERRDDASLTQTLHRHLINGENKPAQSVIQPIQVQQPAFNWNMDENRLRWLVDMFGQIIIARTLLHLPEGAPNLHLGMQRLLSEYTHDQIASLYQYVSTHIPTEDDLREETLAQLNTFISDAKAWALLRQTNVSPWILLTSKPDLIVQLTDDDLARITRLPCIRPYEIQLAWYVATHGGCDTLLRDSILRQIAAMTVENPRSSPLPQSIMETLQSSEVVQAWAKEKATVYQFEWEQVVQENINPLTHDSHITIFDVDRLPSYRALQVFSPTSLGLPRDVHQQNASILITATQDGPGSVEAMLDVMYPVTWYADDDGGAALHANLGKTRVLIEAICFSEDEIFYHLLLDSKKPFRAHLNKTISDVNLPRVIASLPVKVGRRLQDVTGQHLVNIIQNSDKLRVTLQPLNATQCDRLLRALSSNLTSIIPNGDTLGKTLKDLNATQCDRLLHALSDNLTNIIQDGSQLRKALWLLNATQCDRLLHANSDNLTNIIQDGSQLSVALYLLNETQCDRLLHALSNNLADIIRNGTQLGEILVHLDKTQEQKLLNVFPDLTDIIQDVYQLREALKPLNRQKCKALLNALQDSLTTVVCGGAQLGGALCHLDDAQFDELLNILENDLINVLKDGYQLGAALQLLKPCQRSKLLVRLKNDGNNIIENGFHLGAVLRSLDDRQSAQLLSTLQSNLANLIQDSAQLAAALWHLNETNASQLLETMTIHLPAILQSPYDGPHDGLVRKALLDSQRYEGTLFSGEEGGQAAAPGRSATQGATATQKVV